MNDDSEVKTVLKV